jgi:histidinol-phosphate aminotransferase
MGSGKHPPGYGFCGAEYYYNINGITQHLALEALKQEEHKETMRCQIIQEKEKLVGNLRRLAVIKRVYPSDANFLLVKFNKAKDVYQYLLKNGVIVRDRTQLIHCDNCLRISVGTAEENNKLIQLLRKVN